MQNRTAITGMGVVNAIADSLQEFTTALHNGKQQVSQFHDFPAPHGKNSYCSVKNRDFSSPNKCLKMALHVVHQALTQANLSTLDNTALIIATMAADSKDFDDHYPELKSDINTQSAILSRQNFNQQTLMDGILKHYTCSGPRLIINNACASGNIAIGIARDLIQSGRCDQALVIGVEAFKYAMQWGAERAGFVGSKLKPFHADRDGAILGEGAAAIVIENTHSIKRTALAYLNGYGSVCDKEATAITLAEDGSGLYRSMMLSLQEAGMETSDIQYINTHSPGTVMIDAIESKAIANVFSNHTSNLHVNSTKSLLGHLGGAAAITECVATVLQMQNQFIHPNYGLKQPDPQLALTPVKDQPIDTEVNQAISNACGGGGLNTSILLSSCAPSSNTPLNTKRIVITATDALVGEVDVYDYFPKESNYHFMNLAAQIAAVTGTRCLEQAGITRESLPYDSDRFSVITGTVYGGSHEATHVLCEKLFNNPEVIKPSTVLDHGVHLGAALLIRHYAFSGTTYTLTGSALSGLETLLVTFDAIQAGRSDAGICIGFDTTHAPSKALFEPLLPDDMFPQENIAAACCLETASSAKKRGAEILAEITAIEMGAWTKDTPLPEIKTAASVILPTSHQQAQAIKATLRSQHHIEYVEALPGLAGSVMLSLNKAIKTHTDDHTVIGIDQSGTYIMIKITIFRG